MKNSLYVCALGAALFCLGGCNKKDKETAVETAKDQQAKEELKKEYYKQQEQSLTEAEETVQKTDHEALRKKMRDMNLNM